MGSSSKVMGGTEADADVFIITPGDKAGRTPWLVGVCSQLSRREVPA